jgi:hypothetical protein
MALIVVAAGCRVGTGVVMWGPCTPGTDPTGTDGRYAMTCQDGEWTPVMTAEEFVRISRGEAGVVIAPLPKRPTPSTTTSTTAPPVTTTSTTLAPAPAPTITSVTPGVGATSGGTSVTITGTNFVGATTVSFGGNPSSSFTILSNTMITAVTPSTSTAGSVDVTVVTPGGSVTSEDAFTYGVAPSLVSITTNSIGAGTNAVITVYGSGLADVDSITIDGQAADITGQDDGFATFLTPALPVGLYDLTVSSPYGAQTLVAFMYVA